MNPILAALLPPSTGTSGTSASTPSTTTQTPSSSDASSAAQFKSQFDQAVAALENTGSTTQGTTAAANGAQASTAGSTVQSAVAADMLQEALQKKIADLLAKGETVSEIVQQLAASLAGTFAQQFGGDPAAIQSQLQQAFTTALNLPASTGPPLSNADLASALAQQFRQVADVAAGVLGETGQSNRLFAGSNSDAATTAGVQPAPQATDNNPTSADSIANDAAALLASLTASQGDGQNRRKQRRTGRRFERGYPARPYSRARVPGVTNDRVASVGYLCVDGPIRAVESHRFRTRPSHGSAR